LAYLALVANPYDSQAFRRAVSAPRRGVGEATATAVINAARSTGTGDIVGACTDPATLAVVRNVKARQALAVFGAELDRVRRELWAGRSIGHAVVETLMVDGGLVAQFQQRRDAAHESDAKRDAERVLEDLRSLCRAAQTYDDQHPDGASLIELLEQVAGLDSTEVEGPDTRITISTIHRAKGTEAQLVIVLGCEEQLLPSWHSLENLDSSHLEEERRLFYVACTRARDRLVLTRCAERGGRPTDGPSRFLNEAGLI
jgi:DNA helicase-2/ATP-dependent DNA helicase PcrA